MKKAWKQGSEVSKLGATITKKNSALRQNLNLYVTKIKQHDLQQSYSYK